MHKQSTHCETSPSPNTKLITTASPSEADDDLANAPESKPSARTLRVYKEHESGERVSTIDLASPDENVLTAKLPVNKTSSATCSESTKKKKGNKLKQNLLPTFRSQRAPSDLE